MTTFKPDNCSWCGKPTNKLQMRPGNNFGLCPEHCPGIEEPDKVPEHAPAIWHSMSKEEREDWKCGMNMEEIREEHDWMKPPH